MTGSRLYAPTFTWTEDAVDRLCALANEGAPFSAIGADLGLGKNAVIGKMSRLRELGDPRIPPARTSPVRRTVPLGLAPIDELAERLAQGSSVTAASVRIGLTLSQAQALWRRILRELGPQAT